MLIEAGAVQLAPASSSEFRSGPEPGQAAGPERPFGMESAAGDGQPERPAAAGAAGQPVIATALPYFQWDNRDGQAMRVWMPRA